jgi:two-component system sensor kinase FixL
MRSHHKSTTGGADPAFTIPDDAGQLLIEPNAAACELMGFSPDAALPSHLIASLTGRPFAAEVADLQTATTGSKSFPALLLGSDNRTIPAMLTCRRVADAILMEVTDVGNADVFQHGTIDVDGVLRAAVEVAPGSIITIDEFGSILTFNAAAEAAFGYIAEEIIGRNVAELMTQADAEAHGGHLRRHFHTGERHVIGAMRVVEARRKNGETFPVELYIDEVRFGDRRLYAGFLRDISHRREMQAETSTLQRELIHVTRLASMGEMAAALAHELNQPLTAIAAYAEAARLKLARLGESSFESARDSLAKVAAQALRAGEVIRRMRQLATGGAGQRNPENLGVIVREALALATVGATASGIKTTIVERERVPAVICDRIQIQHVIINLVRNARDAFEEVPERHGGTSQARQILIEISADPRSATVRVSDTGPGVSCDLRERLFESFLTTKALGVGLGLPVSRMIIESHGGKMWLEPTSGEGATFKFTLPLEGDGPAT